MANVHLLKPAAEGPKFEQMALFKLFEFEGDNTIVALQKVRIGNGGMQVNPGWKITRPNWIIENINITAHLKAGSYVSVEKRGDLMVIAGFPPLKKSMIPKRAISSIQASGNFSQVALTVLSKIPAQQPRMSYQYNQYLFHYISVDGVVFMCMSDEGMQRRICFAFLEDIKDRFFTAYGKEQPRTARAFAMNEDFARVLAKQMSYWNDPKNDKINAVKRDIDDAKGIMVQNIEKVLERGERIDLLVTRTEEMQEQSYKFKDGSTQLKNKLWWKNVKLWIVIAVLVVILVWLIASAICGFTFSKCR